MDPRTIPIAARVLFTLLLIVSIIHPVCSQEAVEMQSEKSDYIKLVEYMSGVWIAKNPAYDSTSARSVIDIQMHLVYDEERQLLANEVTLRFPSLHYLSWVSFWAYHTGKKTITYDSFGPEGRRISGETKFINDSTFITLERLFEPDGSAKELKDENIIVSDNIHRNISYENKNGNWEIVGVYEWRRG